MIWLDHVHHFCGDCKLSSDSKSNKALWQRTVLSGDFCSQCSLHQVSLACLAHILLMKTDIQACMGGSICFMPAYVLNELLSQGVGTASQDLKLLAEFLVILKHALWYKVCKRTTHKLYNSMLVLFAPFISYFRTASQHIILLIQLGDIVIKVRSVKGVVNFVLCWWTIHNVKSLCLSRYIFITDHHQ